MLQKEGRACDQEHRNDKLAHTETSCFVPFGSVKGLDIVGHVDRGRFPRLVDVASPCDNNTTATTVAAAAAAATAKRRAFTACCLLVRAGHTVVHRSAGDGLGPVSYKPLTLPTNYTV